MSGNDQEYRVRAVHRDVPDMQRLTELMIRLSVQRREHEALQRQEGAEQPTLPDSCEGR